MSNAPEEQRLANTEEPLDDHAADRDRLEGRDRLEDSDRLEDDHDECDDHNDDFDFDDDDYDFGDDDYDFDDHNFDDPDVDDFGDHEGWLEVDDHDPLFPPPDERADERLRQMLERLDAAIPDDIPTVWVRVFTNGEPGARGPEPERIEVDGELPGLIGFVAPPDCIAVAIVGVGRAHRYDPSPRPEHRPGGKAAEPAGDGGGRSIDVPAGGLSARAVCLMDRSGRMAGHTRLENGATIPAPPESGRLVDALRRCFGLPTAAPEHPANELIARLWLANVLAAAEDHAETLGWKQVRELHPSAEVLRAVGVPLTATSLDRAREVAATAWTWARLRRQAIEGDWLPALINPDLAAWMDEGMFSRWVLEGTRTTADLLELVTPSVAPSVLAKLKRAVRT